MNEIPLDWDRRDDHVRRVVEMRGRFRVEAICPLAPDVLHSLRGDDLIEELRNLALPVIRTKLAEAIEMIDAELGRKARSVQPRDPEPDQ